MTYIHNIIARLYHNYLTRNFRSSLRIRNRLKEKIGKKSGAVTNIYSSLQCGKRLYKRLIVAKYILIMIKCKSGKPTCIPNLI